MGRAISTRVYKILGGALLYESSNAYDDESKISEQIREYSFGYDRSRETYSYVYDTRDRLTRVRRSDSEYTDYEYDAFSRVNNVTQRYYTTPLVYSYGYAVNGSNTTQRINSFSVNASEDVSYFYVYDEAGRITEIWIGDEKTHSYEYDNLGQLTRENNLSANKTYVYVYDNAGNRTYRYTYDYTTGALPLRPGNTDYYYYEDSEWGDLLTAYQSWQHSLMTKSVSV